MERDSIKTKHEKFQFNIEKRKKIIIYSVTQLSTSSMIFSRLLTSLYIDEINHCSHGVKQVGGRNLSLEILFLEGILLSFRKRFSESYSINLQHLIDS